MTACCQIICTIPWLPCKQLPYPPEHPRILWIWQRDKSELPLLTLPYKYFLPWHSSSTLSSYILQTHLPSGGSWPLAVKSSAQSLDYRANNYHIHLNTLGFHGYGKEISQNCPCSLYPINTSFLGTPPPPCHPTFSKPIFLAAALFEESENFSKQSFKSSIFFLLGRNGDQLHRPWGQFPTVFSFACRSLTSANLFTEYVFPFFFPFLFFQPSNL